MNKLYLRISPSHLSAWPNDVMSYALCSKDGAILREGRGTLTEMADAINKSKVVAIIAASDVTMLRITVPPMSEAKLKLALPNLVEDQLVGDVTDSVLMLGAKPNNSGASNSRAVAVVSRRWLQQLSKDIFALGASHIRAVPEQLSIPYENNQSSARIDEYEQGSCASFALRINEDSGVGIVLKSEQSIEERLSTMCLLSPSGPISLALPKELIESYQGVIATNPVWGERIKVTELGWADSIRTIRPVGLNLMAGLNVAQAQRIRWQIWRWPLLLATLILLVNIIGLNSHYWALKREVRALNLAMTQTYKQSFPKAAEVPFPLQQMKKSLEIAQRNSGEPAAYDFTVLLTQFGSAWNSLRSMQLPKLVSIEYKDYALVIQVKGNLPEEALKSALAAKGLALKKNNAEVWQVKGKE